MNYEAIIKKWQAQPLNDIAVIDLKLHNFRILFAYHLMINNHPPVVIFDEDRKEYYQALEAFDKKEELEPLVSFLISQLEKTWNKR